jgi:diguanylate cyclase (GGDEF)-like protein
VVQLPEVAGLDVLAELDRDGDRTAYRVRRYGTEYQLTVFDLDRRDRIGTLRRFYREASLLTAIAHPRLPRVHEVGELQGRPYLVTDLVPGRPLAELVTGQPLAVPQALRLILDIVEPLSALHRQGLVHRDLNSRTVIVQADGSARLLDAGLGGGRPVNRPAGGNRPGGGNRRGGKRPGTSLGYRAPEQSGALNRPVDNRTDLYSLGVVLFECLTGTLPFLAAEAGDLARLQIEQGAPDPRTQTADLPASVALLVRTLLTTDPDERYQNGSDLAVELRRLLTASQPDLAEPEQIDMPALFGREQELAVINELWEQARRGHGRGCVLRGDAGVGKTRVTEEVLRIARRDGTPVLAITCLPDEAAPLAAVRRAVQNLVLDADQRPAAERDALHAHLRAAAGDAAPLLAGLSPALGALLATTALPDADRRNQFAAVIARFITDLARRVSGLILVLDNSGEMDAGTLRVMSHLATDLAEVPMLSIANFRIGAQPLLRTNPLVPAMLAATDLDLVLEPLPPTALNALISSRLPGIDPESAPAEMLRAHGAGNPFVLLEHIRIITGAGLLRPNWGSWLLDEGAHTQLQLPTDPLGLVLTELAGLEPDTRRILQVAAVTGFRFRPDDLAEIVDLEPIRAYALLADAARRQLVELDGAGDYRFRHDRTREALLTELGAEDVAQLHQDIAEVLERRLDDETADADERVYAIARHFLLGLPTRSVDRAFEICRTAGRSAIAEQAPGQAVVLLEHADTLRPKDARLLARLGTALYRDRQYPAARSRLEEALVVEKDGLRRGRILLQLTEVHRATRNTRKARLAVEWGLAELDAALPDSAPARAIGAIWAGLVAAVVFVTGWGFGTVRHRRREREEVMAALHLAGAQIGGMDLRPANVLMHRTYAFRAASRLGTGTQYSLSCAAISVSAAEFGFAAMHRRALARAEQAAAQLSDPQLAAQVTWAAGAADYVAGVDNGERWVHCLTDHGHWLDNELFSETTSALCWDAAVQGRDDDVRQWAGNGQARRTFGVAEELTALVTIPAVGLTAVGQPVAANAELGRVRVLLERNGGRSLRVNLVLAELYALLEQNHLGEHFDAVAQRFFAFDLPRTAMLRSHRSFFVLYAAGRLAQCRIAQASTDEDGDELGAEPQPAADVEARLEAARIAVQQLRAVANTALLKAAYRQCRAELLVLQGRSKQALALLSRLQPQREYAPLLGYEIARTTARALLAGGYPADARGQVLGALTLAEDHGWTGRRDRLAAEFGLRSPAQPGAAVQPVFARELSGQAAGLELDPTASLHDTLLDMSSSADSADVLRQLLAAAGRILPGDSAWLIQPAPRVVAGAGPLAQVLFADLPAAGSICELVFDPELRALAAAGQPFVGTTDSSVPPQLRRLLADAASWLFLPLSSDKTLVGVLVVASAEADAYAQSDLAMAGTLVVQGMTAHAKATLITRLQELAGTDELTGIRSLRQVLELAARDLQSARLNSRPLVVMVIDIDHLGKINDLYGRGTGDDVIRQVAIRLGHKIRGTDLLGRYGEDEFIVVLSQGRASEDGIGDGGLEVAERLLAAVSRLPLQTRSGPLAVTVTIGLTLMTPEDTEMVALTERAEIPLHAAKLDGRNQIRGI